MVHTAIVVGVSFVIGFIAGWRYTKSKLAAALAAAANDLKKA